MLFEAIAIPYCFFFSLPMFGPSLAARSLLRDLWLAPFRMTSTFMHRPNLMCELLLASIALLLGVRISIGLWLTQDIMDSHSLVFISAYMPLPYWALFMTSVGAGHMFGVALHSAEHRAGMRIRTFFSFWVLCLYLALLIAALWVSWPVPFAIPYNIPLAWASYCCYKALRYASHYHNSIG